MHVKPHRTQLAPEKTVIIHLNVTANQLRMR